MRRVVALVGGLSLCAVVVLALSTITFSEGDGRY